MYILYRVYVGELEILWVMVLDIIGRVCMLLFFSWLSLDVYY